MTWRPADVDDGALELIGVDGCRGGWLAATADASLTTLSFSLADDLAPLLARARAGEALIGIDMPIGLGDDRARSCDLAARRLLGRPRASSVFPAPCRAALTAATYRRACALSRRALGVALSRETFNILPKIREIDALITPATQRFVREVHPEVVFALLAGRDRGLRHAKRTPAGERERRALLRGIAPRFDVDAVRRRLGRGRVARDDVIDAVACVVAAARIARGEARVLPEGRVPRDARGLRMEIVG